MRMLSVQKGGGGKHILSMKDEGGSVGDTKRFEVVLMTQLYHFVTQLRSSTAALL